MGYLIWSIFVGIIAGWLSGKIMKGRGFGILGDLVVGIVGAVIGEFVFEMIGLRPTGTIGSIIMATIGALILLYAVRTINKQPMI